MATTRESQLLRPLLVVLIAAGAVFGLGPLLVPTQFAELVGYQGRDVFLFRLAGAATFGYSVALAAGYSSRWPALRIPFAATATFNLASILACAIAIVRGDATLVTYLILVSSVLFSSGTLYFLRNPPAEARWTGPQELAGWFVALLVVTTLAAAALGLAGLFGGGASARLLGYGGADDFVYRQAGAATLGYALAGALMLRSRSWVELRLPMLMGLVFNGLGLVAAVLEVAGGGQPVAWLILVVTAVVTALTLLALRRRGG
jgi:hypothetical protein